MGARCFRMPRISKARYPCARRLRRIGPLPVLSGTVARIRTWPTIRMARRATSHGHPVRPGLRREPVALRQLRRQRAPIRARTDPPGRHAPRPPPARPARARGRDLPLPGALPGGANLSRGELDVHAVTVCAAYAYTTAELRGAEDRHGASRRAAAATSGKLLTPGAFGVIVLEEIASEAPRFGAERAALERKRLGLDDAAVGALLVGLSSPTTPSPAPSPTTTAGRRASPADAEVACRPDRRRRRRPALGGNEIDRTLLRHRARKWARCRPGAARRGGRARRGRRRGRDGDPRKPFGRLEAVADTAT